MTRPRVCEVAKWYSVWTFVCAEFEECLPVEVLSSEIDFSKFALSAAVQPPSTRLKPFLGMYRTLRLLYEDMGIKIEALRNGRQQASIHSFKRTDE